MRTGIPLYSLLWNVFTRYLYVLYLALSTERSDNATLRPSTFPDFESHLIPPIPLLHRDTRSVTIRDCESI